MRHIWYDLLAIYKTLILFHPSFAQCHKYHALKPWCSRSGNRDNDSVGLFYCRQKPIKQDSWNSVVVSIHHLVKKKSNTMIQEITTRNGPDDHAIWYFDMPPYKKRTCMLNSLARGWKLELRSEKGKVLAQNHNWRVPTRTSLYFKSNQF